MWESCTTDPLTAKQWVVIGARAVLLLGGLDLGMAGVSTAMGRRVSLIDGLGAILPFRERYRTRVTTALRMLVGISAAILLYFEWLRGLPVPTDATCTTQRTFGLVYLSVVGMALVVGIYGGWRYPPSARIVTT